MIETRRGDILKVDAEALVNTVNCVGVMGRGVALQFRKAFPENFNAYKDVCRRGELHPGRMFVFELPTVRNPRYVVNFPTKRHWKGKSQLEDIRIGLAALVEEIQERGIQSIAIPPLGCGLGGLDWREVRPLIERAFESLPNVRAILFEPAGAPAGETTIVNSMVPRLTAGRAALVALMRRYLDAAMDTGVSLLEIHKLMYFMQATGENLRLRFEKGHYGPYAKNLRHVLIEIEGHLTRGYGDGTDDPQKEITLTAPAFDRASEFLASHPDTLANCDKVATLIEGFETPYGMELLSSVDWVCRHESARTADDATKLLHSWNDRKLAIPREHVRLAWNALEDRGKFSQ